MQIANIIFMQGEEADNALMWLENSEDSLLDYLKQWDNGEYYDIEEFETIADFKKTCGLASKFIVEHPYIMSYSVSYQYAGLSKVIE